MLRKALLTFSGIVRQQNCVKHVPVRNVSREHLRHLKELKQQARLSFKKDEKMGAGGYLLLICPLTAFGLGCWQVQRKQWKEDLIKNLDEKTKMPAVPCPDNLQDIDFMEYRKIIVRGEFLHDRELIMGPRSLITDGDVSTAGGGIFTQQSEKHGFHVVTPFKLEGRDDIILVNRGWVPASLKNPMKREAGQVKGIVEFEGIVRLQEARPQFQPEHRDNMFFYRDLVKMCKYTGAQPYFIDACVGATVPGGPVGGQTRVTMRNEHMSYIITWFSLSAFTGYLWYQMVFKKFARKR
ncbi:SURF1-like protein [Culicoides brevitarsis]|uniref:SURF1-like protein n=1 Tax=Culicoides brevitarsis TaxID=469753 RepID=UPI00307B41AE